ncbi:hypothetical protein [Archangium violaceum]|uniref:hypothetical protein n=1 Tax=Archangium violaceum TaxID=83451 RepID=UPI001EF46C9B|nr:hypothetical protein [Archangium violaceum]
MFLMLVESSSGRAGAAGRAPEAVVTRGRAPAPAELRAAGRDAVPRVPAAVRGRVEAAGLRAGDAPEPDASPES